MRCDRGVEERHGFLPPIATKSDTYSPVYNSCVACHGNLEGLNPKHENVRCDQCHLGQPEMADAAKAHIGMISIPGNTSDMRQTCGQCHIESIQQVENSLMTTNSGIVGVDRVIFGESDSINGHYNIKDIGFTAADTHVRNLCANCHLGHAKEEFGPIHQKSRGGGCNACHLNYSAASTKHLERFLADSTLPKNHPSLDLAISDMHCFGCHSRSGRISTNSMGLHETTLRKEEIGKLDSLHVMLDDERIYKKMAEDIHHQVGLSCIDCHAFEEVMGDGLLYAHEEDAVKVACEDCHFSGQPNTISYADLSVNQKRILLSRGDNPGKKDMIRTRNDDRPLLNTLVESWGKHYLMGKLTNAIHPLPAPAEDCTRNAHENLTCSACHTSWAPQCVGCHVDFEPGSNGYDLKDRSYMEGTWKEYTGGFFAEAPTLGVAERDGKKAYMPAIPGMIMTLDKSNFNPHDTLQDFFRLFAPAVPHTITREVRDCASCHWNPLALGYGRGTFSRIDSGEFASVWFESTYANRIEDKLPQDAWIGFFEEGTPPYSTRDYFRPILPEEQIKILSVGICLSCHPSQSREMTQSLTMPFEDYLKTVSDECKLPLF
jgi:hypothetical protein